LTRITLDTNEYISALAFGGNPLHILHMAIDGEVEIAISEPILSEVVRVLRQKFEWPPCDLLDARQRIQAMTPMVEPKETLDVISYDPPDNRILECAVEAGSECIISEDKDLLRLGTCESIKIMRGTDFLKQSLSR
jgi:putative PIN family toxin of toxin-antitoxin system